MLIAMSEPMISLSIPIELNHAFFFSKGEITFAMPQSFCLTENFLYELLYYHGISSYRPWQNPSKTVPMIVADWETEKASIEELFKKKDKAALLPKMKKGIGLFIQLLFWSNERPVELKTPLSFDDIPYKPVNVGERLAFIMERPCLFPSFRLLSQIMVEQEKRFVKKSLKENAQSSEG